MIAMKAQRHEELRILYAHTSLQGEDAKNYEQGLTILELRSF